MIDCLWYTSAEAATGQRVIPICSWFWRHLLSAIACSTGSPLRHVLEERCDRSCSWGGRGDSSLGGVVPCQLHRRALDGHSAGLGCGSMVPRGTSESAGRPRIRAAARVRPGSPVLRWALARQIGGGEPLTCGAVGGGVLRPLSRGPCRVPSRCPQLPQRESLGRRSDWIQGHVAPND